MTRRRTFLDDTALARRNHALQIIRQEAVRGPWGRKPIAYANARRILTEEYGYTNAQIFQVRRNARYLAERGTR